MSDFLHIVASRFGGMIYGAIKGAAYLYMLDDFNGIDLGEATKKHKCIDSLNLYLAEDIQTGEYVLSLQAEIDGEIHNSLDYDSEIRISEGLQVHYSGELETEFEYLALNVLTALSMTLMSQGIVNIDFDKFKRHVTSIFHYPCLEFDGGFAFAIPKMKGMKDPFLVSFYQQYGDVFVEMSNGLTVENGEEEVLGSQESMRLTIDGKLIQTPLMSEVQDEVFRNFYGRMEDILVEIFKGFAETFKKQF